MAWLLARGRPSVDHVDRPEALERAVDEEHLERDVGLYMRLAEKRQHLTISECSHGVLPIGPTNLGATVQTGGGAN